MNTVGVSTVVFSVLMAITGEHFVIEVRTVEPPIADPPIADSLRIAEAIIIYK